MSDATGTPAVTATIDGQTVGTGATVDFTLANRGLPVISGTAQDGLVLSRGEGTWSTGQKLTYTQQWERCTDGGLDCAAIAGAAGSVYRATSADIGDQITVVVTATDANGQTATATATPTMVVADPAAPLRRACRRSPETAQAGQVLTLTSRGRWSSPDPLRLTVQWERCDPTGHNCTAITGATAVVYRLTAADIDDQVTVAVTATDLESQQTTAAAAPTGAIADPGAPAEITAPTFTGTPQAGQVLTITSRGRWNSPLPLTFTLQWQRCTPTGTDCTNIAGATGFVYRLKATDIGEEVTVAVTATDTLKQQTTATAAPTAVVTAPPSTS